MKKSEKGQNFFLFFHFIINIVWFNWPEASIPVNKCGLTIFKAAKISSYVKVRGQKSIDVTYSTSSLIRIGRSIFNLRNFGTK